MHDLHSPYDYQRCPWYNPSYFTREGYNCKFINPFWFFPWKTCMICTLHMITKMPIAILHGKVIIVNLSTIFPFKTFFTYLQALHSHSLYNYQNTPPWFNIKYCTWEGCNYVNILIFFPLHNFFTSMHSLYNYQNTLDWNLF